MDSVKGLALAAMMLLASATMLVFAMGDFSVDEEIDSSKQWPKIRYPRPGP